MIFFVILLAFHPAPQADGNSTKQHDPAAVSVIEEFVIAKGGEAALRKIKNYTLKGKVLSKNKVVGEFEVYQAANRNLSIDRFPDGSTRQSGTDGKLAWRIDVDGKPTLFKGQEARDFIRHHATLHQSLDWQNECDAIFYAGPKQVQDCQTHHLIFVAPDNRQINRYFSLESGLLIREEQVVGTGKNTLIQISEIGDYVREKNGVSGSRWRLNHLNRLGSKYSIEFKTDSVETNTLTDDSLFSVPEAVTKLVDEKAK